MVAESVGLVKHYLNTVRADIVATAAEIRASEFFREAADQFGQREGGVIVIPMRQCELARRKGVAPSTIGAHLRAIEEHVVSRAPEIVINLDSSTPAPAPKALARASVSGELQHALLDLCAVQARVIDLLGGSATFPREDCAETRGSANSTDETLAVFDQESTKEDLRTSRQPEPARNRAESARPQHHPAGDLDAALQPLVELAQRRQLKPINNRPHLYEALSGYTPDQISAAVTNISHMIRRSDSTITSPFGLLVRAARNNDSEMFTISPNERPVVDELQPDEAPVDPAAESRIDLYETHPEQFADELGQLDATIALEHSYLAGRGIGPMLRHRLRVAAYQQRDRPAGTASEALLPIQALLSTQGSRSGGGPS